MRRSIRLFLTSTVAVAAVTATVAAGTTAAAARPGPAAAQAAARPASATAAQPFVRGGQTVPIYSYAKAIHETVYVQAPFDSDHDGQPDRIAVDIIRPAEAAAAHVRVPVIMDASPYFQCCGRGNENETKTYEADGNIGKLPLYYDNYFVPRGYAVAGVDLTGTSRSTGCGDVGGQYEVLGAKAAIDWLNGRAVGYDVHGRRVNADWSTGKVGMIGKSWDGSIANGVAATGVEGLSTVVAISAISSWYDYTRFGGVLRSPGYVSFLDDYVGGRPPGVCNAVYNAEQAASDDSTGNFNAFWRARDYRLDASKVRAAMFIVHGLNDQNVTTNQFADWWKLLAARGVPRKIWLSQMSHVDPFDIRRAAWVKALHQWFDHWLQCVQNGVMNQPQASVERSGGAWVNESSWPAPDTSTVPVRLSALGGPATRTFTDAPAMTEAEAVADPTADSAGRAVFLSGSLAQPVRVSGSPSVTLRIKVNRPTTELSARLVDYGRQHRIDYQTAGEGISTLSTQSCWGESTAVDDACYFNTVPDFVTSDVDIITRGWLDAAHHRSLRMTTPLVPGRWYSITVPIDATDAVFAAGHRLALVVTQSDEEYTSPTPTGATVTIDPSSSFLRLPLTGNAAVPTRAVRPVGTVAAPTSRPVSVRVAHRLTVPAI